MRRGIAFDWWIFIPTSMLWLVATAFEWFTKGKIDTKFVLIGLISLAGVSVLSGIENRIDKALKRIAEIEKKLKI